MKYGFTKLATYVRTDGRTPPLKKINASLRFLDYLFVSCLFRPFITRWLAARSYS